MSKAPEVCLYCKGTGIGPGSPCGFCVEGVPLDTQEDWDNSWGKLFKSLKLKNSDWHRKLYEKVDWSNCDWREELRQKKIADNFICSVCYEWPEFCCCEAHGHKENGIMEGET